jgi:hypothetical protein
MLKDVDNVHFLYIFLLIFVHMKYNNALRVSFPDITYFQIRKLKDITGIKTQDIIRRAVEEYCEKETKRLQKMIKVKASR